MVTSTSSTTSTSKTTTPDEPDYIEPEPDDPLDQVENDPEGRYQRPHHPSTGQPPEIVDGKSYPAQYPPFIARPGILAGKLVLIFKRSEILITFSPPFLQPSSAEPSSACSAPSSSSCSSSTGCARRTRAAIRWTRRGPSGVAAVER